MSINPAGKEGEGRIRNKRSEQQLRRRRLKSFVPGIGKGIQFHVSVRLNRYRRIIQTILYEKRLEEMKIKINKNKIKLSFPSRISRLPVIYKPNFIKTREMNCKIILIFCQTVVR